MHLSSSRKFLATSSLVVVALFAAQAAQAETITALDGSQGWVKSDVRVGGTADIVDIGSAGGNLQNNAPLPTGAVKLTTDATNAAKAEVGIGGNFGTIGDFLNGGSLSYSYYKQSAGDLNAFATAAIKLTVEDASISTAGTTDGYATFIYEPNWNQAGSVGSSVAVPTDDWYTALLNATTGVFWSTGIYGDGNQSGGPGMTLADWDAKYLGDLASAVITGISVGVGSYNQGQTAFFDNVTFASGDLDLAYDFELAAVPVPAALPLALGGLAFLGFTGWRKRRTGTA